MTWVHVWYPRYDGAQLIPEINKKSVVGHYAGFCDLCVAGLFCSPLLEPVSTNQNYGLGKIFVSGGPVSFVSYKPSHTNFPCQGMLKRKILLSSKILSTTSGKDIKKVKTPSI